MAIKYYTIFYGCFLIFLVAANIIQTYVQSDLDSKEIIPTEKKPLTIGNPTGVVHVGHINYDKGTGEYDVRFSVMIYIFVLLSLHCSL